jgi:hypothetical protein
MSLLLLGLQIPQYVRNYKTKSAEALSPWFLASWLLVSTAASAVASVAVALQASVH